MAYPAGTAWLFDGRTYHAALHNDSDEIRRVLIYNYGHFWMKIWQGYEPSEALKAKAKTPVMQQRELQDGDRIQLGNILLRFQARAAVIRARKGSRVTAARS